MDPNNSSLQTLEEDLKKMSGDQPDPIQAPPIEVPSNSPSLNIPQEPTPQAPVQVPAPSPAVESVQPPQEPQKGSPIITVAVVLGIVALLAIAAYAVGTMFTNKNVGQQACTVEAKICPDGSSVGRTGPNCEFAECPTFIPTPIETPIESASPSATPLATVTPKPTSTPKSSPSVTPPAY